MDQIAKAVSILKEGGVIVYPSVSSYGIGCDATNVPAVRRIYKIKGRPASKGMLVLVSSLSMAKKYGVINRYAETLIKKFMPGPLTLIVPKKDFPDEVNKDFAFRIAVHPVAMELVKGLGRPIVSTSANLSGNTPIYSIAKVKEEFGDKVDYIVDVGNLPRNPPSTIVKEGKIVRKGAVNIAV